MDLGPNVEWATSIGHLRSDIGVSGWAWVWHAWRASPRTSHHDGKFVSQTDGAKLSKGISSISTICGSHGILTDPRAAIRGASRMKAFIFMKGRSRHSVTHFRWACLLEGEGVGAKDGGSLKSLLGFGYSTCRHQFAGQPSGRQA